MSNRKSIFFKYFVICSAVILISFVCLGTVLLLVSSRYFIDEKKSLLEKNTKALALYTQEEMLAQPADWKKSVTDEMMQYSMACNADFILCDSTGAVLVNSSKDPVCSPHNISVHELEAFSDNCEYVYSDLGGAFDAIYHVIGKSFKANGPEYYVLAFSSKAAQDDYTYNIMEIFIVSAIIVLVIVMFLVYFMTLKLTEPIKEIAEVSKKIGAGDFSVTLPDYSTSELEQLSNAFNDMAASLKSYDTMRNSFLANVSHELRTPMTSIGGFVDGLLDGTIPKEQERYYLKIISSEVHRLARLVRSMLNLAKIEAGELKPNLQYFSVLEPIVDTLVTFEPRLEEKQIEIRGLDVDRVILYADNDLVHQVMYNLIENAIKFVDKGGYIEFHFEPEGNMTSISIRNSGEGLSEDELPLVFDRFYKTDKSRGLDKTGVGLGLNIVRSIIKLHGGKIMVRSVKNEYTEFVFTLPNKAEGDYEGIGFAVSIDEAKPVIEELMEKGYVAGRVKIGVTYYAVSDTTAEIYGIKPGICIVSINPDCDVANTDLAEGDIITEIDGKSTAGEVDIASLFSGKQAGDEVVCKVYRKTDSGDEKEFEIKFKLMADNGGLVTDSQNK